MGKEEAWHPSWLRVKKKKKNHMNMAMSHVYTKNMSETWPVYDEDFLNLYDPFLSSQPVKPVP